MRIKSLVTACGLLVCTTLAYAEVQTIANLTMTRLATGSRGDIFQTVEVPRPSLGAGQEIVYAEFSFEEGLPNGAEVEVWPAVAGEAPPWERPDILGQFGRNIWVVDERTGSYVKFDVTTIARAWSDGTLENHGLQIRVLSMEGLSKGLQDVTPGKVTFLSFVDPVIRPGTEARDEKCPPPHTHQIGDGSGGN